MVLNVAFELTDEIRPIDVVGISPMPVSGLIQLINGHYVAQAIYTFAYYNIADLLAVGPMTAAQISEETGTERNAIERLLRVASGVGLVDQASDGHYALAEVGEFLQTDVEGSLHSFALLQGAPWRWAPMGRMVEAVKTGDPQFASVHGQTYYDYLESHPPMADIFQGAMSCLASSGQVLAAAAHDFSTYTTLFDIGGGDGTVLSSILGSHPSLEGRLLDRAHAIGKAKATMDAVGLTDRVRFHEIDFIEAIPGGGDCYLLSDILCDCDDQAAQPILRNCAQAMSAESTLVVLDQIMPPGRGLHHADYLDLEELIFTGGLARTVEQWEKLFDDNGLRLSTIEDTIIPLMNCMVVRKK